MRRMKVPVVAVVIAGVIAGCGGGEKPKDEAATAGKVVQGQTENGTTLKVESFVSPATDPVLKQLDAYRIAGGYPAVDYHRVTATAGAMADRPRVVTFAAKPGDLSAGKGIDGRFGCDVLNYEWVPIHKATPATYTQLKSKLCAVKPSAGDDIKPGAKVVYYLVTDRGFDERNLRAKNIFGPRDVQFTPVEH